MQEQLAINVKETAKLLNVGERTIYKMIREKRLPAYRFGRRIVIGRKVLEAISSGEWQQPIG